MKSYSSKEVIAILLENDWYLERVKGSHHQYKHKNKNGKVTVPHPKKDLPLGTLKSIERQSGLKFD
jgi:predicted RNA binding protein YcfA (HicA-like mRNA interferase family)